MSTAPDSAGKDSPEAIQLRLDDKIKDLQNLLDNPKPGYSHQQAVVSARDEIVTLKQQLASASARRERNVKKVQNLLSIKIQSVARRFLTRNRFLKSQFQKVVFLLSIFRG